MYTRALVKFDYKILYDVGYTNLLKKKRACKNSKKLISSK